MARIINDRDDVIPHLGEIFRTHGYEGASLSVITAGTGLGKGSLYNFFPGGKAEMAEEVLRHIDRWFQDEVYTPLRQGGAEAVAASMRAVETYFRSGRRVCLVGVFALDDTRDRFPALVHDYFRDWIDALAGALTRAGVAADTASALALDVVAGIQGGLVMARALDRPEAFTEILGRLSARMAHAIAASVS